MVHRAIKFIVLGNLYNKLFQLNKQQALAHVNNAEKAYEQGIDETHHLNKAKHNFLKADKHLKKFYHSKLQHLNFINETLYKRYHFSGNDPKNIARQINANEHEISKHKDLLNSTKREHAMFSLDRPHNNIGLLRQYLWINSNNLTENTTKRLKDSGWPSHLVDLMAMQVQNKQRLRQLESYIEPLNHEKMQELLNAGWDKPTIEMVRFRVHLVTEDTRNLHNYVLYCLRNRETPDAIKERLTDVGWHEQVVDNILYNS